MQVSKITIGRLYNLGSYEHVRYELTVEIGEGDSAETAVKAVENILAAMAPTAKAGIKSESEIAHGRKEIETMKTMPAVSWERQYGHCTGTPQEVIARYEQQLEAAISKRNDVLARAKRARELFDDLGGASVWKDAKQEWDTDDDY